MSKLTQIIDKTITSLSAQDLAGVRSIKGYAFAKCVNLQSITIPLSASSIGQEALSACTNLTDITILNDINLVPSNSALRSVNRNIYVPNNLVFEYFEEDNYSYSSIGFKKYNVGEILGNGAVWYPTKADLIAKTNGIKSNGINTATSTGIWYADYNILVSSTEIDFSTTTSTTFVYDTDSTSNVIEAGDYSSYDAIGVSLSYSYANISNKMIGLAVLENNITFNGVTYDYGKVVKVGVNGEELFIGFNNNSTELVVVGSKKKVAFISYPFKDIKIYDVKVYKN